MCRKCTAAANEWYLMRTDDCTESGIFFFLSLAKGRWPS